MAQIKTDLLVIGAGSGGLSVAAGAAQLGADVTLLEPHKMGGDCLNYGCVPSKALLAAAKQAQAARTANRFGISAKVSVDYAMVMNHVRDVIAQIEPHDSQSRFQGLGVRVLRHAGRFIGPQEVEAGPDTIRARRIVIATGASAFIPPIPGLDQVEYLTNETIFDATVCPDHLIVLGAGPIGVEMAQAHRRLGAKVTIVDIGPFVPSAHPEDANILRQRFVAEGIDIVENAVIEKLDQKDGVRIELAGQAPITGSHILVATGRRANVQGLGLDAAGISYTAKGISVDARLRTSNPKVYAIGDVIGGAQFTHVAGYHAGVVVQSALFGLPAKAMNTTIPTVIYCDPEIAQVGMTMDEAREKYGASVETVKFDHSGNDRLVAERATTGHSVVLIVRGRAVGARVVGVQAGEMINFWTYMITHREKVSKLTKMISPYPTVTEINKRVAGVYFSPKLFDNEWVKRIVRFIQKRLP